MAKTRLFLSGNTQIHYDYFPFKDVDDDDEFGEMGSSDPCGKVYLDMRNTKKLNRKTFVLFFFVFLQNV